MSLVMCIYRRWASFDASPICDLVALYEVEYLFDLNSHRDYRMDPNVCRFSPMAHQKTIGGILD
jgi:hypothetical protein